MPRNADKSKTKPVVKKVKVKAPTRPKQKVKILSMKPLKRSQPNQDGEPVGFQQSVGATVLSTTINPRAGMKESESFPFRECVGPNVQTLAGQGIGSLLSYGDASGVGLQLANWDMNPSDPIAFGTRITQESCNWEYFKFETLTVEWCPIVGTGAAGAIIVSYDYDPLGQTPTPNTQGYKVYSEFANAISTPIWQPVRMPIRVKDAIYPVKRFYTDIAKSADFRQVSQGQIYLASAGGLGAPAVFGQLWISGTVVFSQRQFNPPVKGVGLQATGAIYPTGGGGGQNLLNITGSVFTGKDPNTAFLANGPDGQPSIFLSPGTYQSDMCTFMNPSTSNSAGALIFGTSSLQNTPQNFTGEVAQVINKRSDSSNVAASAVTQSFSATKQEVVTVPFGGTWYRPQIQTPAYVGTANPATITINLTSLAASVAGLISGLFADPLHKRLHDDYIFKTGDKFYKTPGHAKDFIFLDCKTWMRETNFESIYNTWKITCGVAENCMEDYFYSQYNKGLIANFSIFPPDGEEQFRTWLKDNRYVCEDNNVSALRTMYNNRPKSGALSTTVIN